MRERVSLDFWHQREIPPLDRILGDLVTTTSRIMVIGPTGIGKTNWLLAAAMAMADGADFLHWRGRGRPRGVLYIDGEMSRRLFKTRARSRAGYLRRGAMAAKGVRLFEYRVEDGCEVSGRRVDDLQDLGGRSLARERCFGRCHRSRWPGQGAMPV